MVLTLSRAGQTLHQEIQMHAFYSSENTGATDGFQAPWTFAWVYCLGCYWTFSQGEDPKVALERPRSRILELQDHLETAEGEKEVPARKDLWTHPGHWVAFFPPKCQARGLCAACTIVSFRELLNLHIYWCSIPDQFKPNARDRAWRILTHECAAPKNMRVDPFIL